MYSDFSQAYRKVSCCEGECEQMRIYEERERHSYNLQYMQSKVEVQYISSPRIDAQLHK